LIYSELIVIGPFVAHNQTLLLCQTAALSYDTHATRPPEVQRSRRSKPTLVYLARQPSCPTTSWTLSSWLLLVMTAPTTTTSLYRDIADRPHPNRLEAKGNAPHHPHVVSPREWVPAGEYQDARATSRLMREKRKSLVLLFPVAMLLHSSLCCVVTTPFHLLRHLFSIVSLSNII